MVATNKLYSPSEFVEVLTGKYYIFNGTNDIDDIHIYLYENGIETEECQLWDYSLDAIDHIVENNIPVVLVSVLVEDDDGKLNQELRWFEIPADCIVDFEEV
jgi:hypothetical protein